MATNTLDHMFLLGCGGGGGCILGAAEEEAEADAAEATVRDRLGRDSSDSVSPLALAYREAASVWLERGQPRVALSLLERAQSASAVDASAVAGGSRSAALRLAQDGALADRPGVAGLPALTSQESQELGTAETPEEALVVLNKAKTRLEEHGEEARRLLRRWLARRS